MTTETLESEWVDSDRFMGPKMKRITFRCEKCNHVWVRTLKAEPKKNPPCPNRRCVEVAEVAELKRELANLKAMLESGVAPATIGANLRVKAVDETARIVMEDQHLTDLKDNLRPGDTMAPSLPAAQQRLADAMFSPKTDKVMPVITSDGSHKTIPASRMQAIGMRAIRGAYRNASVAPTQVLPKWRPAPVSIRNDRYDATRPTAEGRKAGGAS